jgi:hypothetical protein
VKPPPYVPLTPNEENILAEAASEGYVPAEDFPDGATITTLINRGLLQPRTVIIGWELTSYGHRVAAHLLNNHIMED